MGDQRFDALPSAELAGYILGEDGSDRHLAAFQLQGEQIRDAIVRDLGPAWTWHGKRVLDFGCGAGRVLRQLIPLAEGAELHGCDIDDACIGWLEQNLSPPLHVCRSGPAPPLSYPEAHFDFIYATSVFSHLTDSWAAWLLELRRMLAPGGWLLVSVMGSVFSEPIAHEPWDADRIGMTVRGYGRPWSAGGPMVLHSEWWVRAHWGRAFEVVAYDEGGICGQDGVLMRRVASDTLTPAALLAPEPGEARELRAAQHAIDLLHREHAELNASHDAYAAAYAVESERLHAAQSELVAARGEAKELTELRARVQRLQAGTLRGRALRIRRRLSRG